MNELFEKLPHAARVGNTAMGLVSLLESKRQRGRIAEYDRALRYIDTALQGVDTTLAAARAGQGVAWREVAQQATTQLETAMQAVNALKAGGLQGWDIPIAPAFESDPVVGQGMTGAMTPQGAAPASMKVPDAGPVLTTLAVRLRAARMLVQHLRDLEVNASKAGLSGFGSSLAVNPMMLALSWAMLGACAYHGYGRTKTVGNGLLWALWPFFFGIPGGGIALAIAVQQGFGKPMPPKVVA